MAAYLSRIIFASCLMSLSVLISTVPESTSASGRLSMSSGVYIMVLTKVVKREGAIKNLDRQFRVYVAVRKNGELQVSEATMKGKPKKTVFLKGKLRKERFKGKFYERGQTVKVTGKLVSPNTLQGNIAHPRINPELGFLEMRINLSKSKNE